MDDKPIVQKDGDMAVNFSQTSQAVLGSSHQNETAGEQEREKDDMALCMMFLRKKVHFLPIVTFLFIVASFFISYGVSVSQGNVEPDFPYISYTAIEVPERCIFAQLINMGACLMAFNVLIRYLQLREVLKCLKLPQHHRRLNIASLVIGFLSAFGLSMVANFQTVVMRPGHYTGAGLAFIMGLVYCWIQTSMAWKLRRFVPYSGIAISQLVNSILLSIFLVAFAISKAVYKISEAKKVGTKEDKLRGVYLVSTVTEWLTALAIVTFVLTFIPDFKRAILILPRVSLTDPRFLQVNGTRMNGHVPDREDGPEPDAGVPMNSLSEPHNNV